MVRACRLLITGGRPASLQHIFNYYNTDWNSQLRETRQKGSSNLPATTRTELSPVECEEFAEAYADKILNPSFAPLRPAMITTINNPETLKAVAGHMGLPMPAAFPDPEWQRDFADAIQKMDRERLIGLVKTWFLKNPPKRADVDFVVKTDFGALMRETFKAAAREFPAKRGAKAKATRRDYPKIAKLADELYPVCLRVVTELRFGGNHSVHECLERCKKQFPEECNFLFVHLRSFESTLSDRRLHQRAKGIESFARLAADGIAGADYGLEPRTSIERTREGRRMLARTHR